jgi:hypothetical protein
MHDYYEIDLTSAKAEYEKLVKTLSPQATIIKPESIRWGKPKKRRAKKRRK